MSNSEEIITTKQLVDEELEYQHHRDRLIIEAEIHEQERALMDEILREERAKIEIGKSLKRRRFDTYARVTATKRIPRIIKRIQHKYKSIPGSS